MTLSRRQFMSRGLLAAAGGLTAPVWFQWLSEQTAKLQPRKHVQLAEPRSLLKPEFRSGGLQPVPGQPGLFFSESGRVIGIRDFNESDKWDTVEIHPRRYEKRYLDKKIAMRDPETGVIYNARILGIG